VRILAINDLVQDALYERPLQNYGELRRKYEPLGSSQGSSQKSSQKNSAEKKPWLFFQENPFFVLKKLMTPSAGICHRAEGRGTCRMSFEISAADLTTLKTVPSYRLYLLCGVYDRTKPQIKADIEFPTPLEITFNQTPIKDNVKGIKNKPGTAKPADLTPFINPQNVLEMVYAFTKQDFLVFCYMVEKVPPNRLLQKILASPRTPKDVTVQEIVAGNDDDDEIQEMSTVLSLKCPVSFMRMKYPVKSIYCHHLPCFDALQFIYLQEQVATWNCPYCNNKISVKDLSLNEYVLDILKNTSDDCDSVEIDLDGSWHPMYENSDGVLVRMEKPPQAKQPEPEIASCNEEDEQNTKDDGAMNSGILQIPEQASVNPSAPPKKTSPVVISLDSDDDDFDPDPVPIQPQVRQQSPFAAQQNASAQLTSESATPVLPQQVSQQHTVQSQALHSQVQSTTKGRSSEMVSSASQSDISAQSEQGLYAPQLRSSRPLRAGQPLPIQPNMDSGAQLSPVFPTENTQQSLPTVAQGHLSSMRIPASQTRVIPMVFAFAAPLLQNSAGQAVTITNGAMQSSLHPIVFQEYLKATVGNARMRDFTYISQIQYYFLYHQDAILNTYQTHLQQQQQQKPHHHYDQQRQRQRIGSFELSQPSVSAQQQQQLVPNSSTDEGCSISLPDLDSLFEPPNEARKGSIVEKPCAETPNKVVPRELQISTELSESGPVSEPPVPSPATVSLFSESPTIYSACASVVSESGVAAESHPSGSMSSVNVTPVVVSSMTVPVSSSASSVAESAVGSSEVIPGTASMHTILPPPSEASIPSQVQSRRPPVTVATAKKGKLEKSNGVALTSQTAIAHSTKDVSMCTSARSSVSSIYVSQGDNSINIKDGPLLAAQKSAISAAVAQRPSATQSTNESEVHPTVPSSSTTEATSAVSEFHTSVATSNTSILPTPTVAPRVPVSSSSSLIGSKTLSQNGADRSESNSEGTLSSAAVLKAQNSAPRTVVSVSPLKHSASIFSTQNVGIGRVSPKLTAPKVNSPTVVAPKITVPSSGILSGQRLTPMASTLDQIASSPTKSPSISSTIKPVASQHLTPSTTKAPSKSTTSPVSSVALAVEPLDSRLTSHQSNYDRERSGLLALKKRFYELTKGSSNISANSSSVPLPPPHKVSQPSPSSLIPNLNVSPLFGISNRSSSASPPQVTDRSRSPSIGSVTNAQSQLKSNLDNYAQKKNIQRANTINLPNSGSSKALDRIHDLHKNIVNGIENSQKALSTGSNGRISSVPSIQRVQSTNSNFSPTRFSSGSPSTNSDTSGGASTVEAPKVTSNGQNILGINIQSESRPVVKPRPTSNIFLPSRKPPHTHLEKKRSSSGTSDQALKKPVT
jgi:hypothetical protein